MSFREKLVLGLLMALAFVCLCLLIRFDELHLKEFLHSTLNLREEIALAIIPVLLGFALEGIFFVLLLGYLQERWAKKESFRRKNELKETLADLIDALVLRLYHLYPDADWSLQSLQATKSQENYYDFLMRELTKDEPLSDGFKTAAWDHVVALRTAMISFGSITTEIDSNHALAWVTILEGFHHITEKKPADITRKDVRAALFLVRRFVDLKVRPDYRKPMDEIAAIETEVGRMTIWGASRQGPQPMSDFYTSQFEAELLRPGAQPDDRQKT